MGNKSAVVLSVLISVLLTSGISYFMIPYLAPAPPELEEPDEIPAGLILQSITCENSTLLSKNDDNLTRTVIPSMETTITTGGNSTLDVMFNALLFLYIHPDLIEGTGLKFNISLEIEGITNQSVIILHQRGADNANYIFAEFYPCSVFLRAETPMLVAGTYSINVSWESLVDGGGSNQLKTGAFLVENPYSLNVKEISA